MAWEVDLDPTLAVVAVALAVTLAPAGLGETTATLTVDEEGAKDFARDAMWHEMGTSVDFPGHVVFPEDSLRVIDGLRAADAAGRADPAHAAQAVAPLQTELGGFLPMQGAFLGPTTSATGAALELADRHDVDIDEAAAVAFLEAMQNTDGGFAPRYSLGGGTLGSMVSSTYYAALGLEAVGELDTDTRIEIRGFLLQAQNPDGGWADPPSEDVSETTATSYAVRTLALMDLLDPTAAAGATAYLKAAEDPRTGGFEETYEPPTCLLCEDEPASVPSTGRALITLAILPPEGLAPGFSLEDHAAWLAERQVEEGLFEGALPLFGEAPPNPVHEAYTSTGVGPEWLPAPFPRPDPPVTDWSRNTALALAGLAEHGLADALDRDAAAGFLAASQHPGTGGFGSWPGYLHTLADTAAAHRTLDTLQATDPVLADALGDTLSDWQLDDGHVQRPTWDLETKPEHTAHAAIALGHANRSDAIDTAAAAEVLADAQAPDGTVDLDPNGVSSFPEDARWTVAALDHLGGLHRLDAGALASALGDLQAEDGAISDATKEAARVQETADALRALATIDRLDVVDAAAASDRLADEQAADGSFQRPLTAAHVVLGLDATDALDQLDRQAATAYLAGQQGEHGGFAEPGFPIGPTPMQRHALIVEALDALGAWADG